MLHTGSPLLPAVPFDLNIPLAQRNPPLLPTATVGAAQALGLPDRGALAPGLLADLQVWDLPSFEDMIYRLGNNAVMMVVKRGKVYSEM